MFNFVRAVISGSYHVSRAFTLSVVVNCSAVCLFQLARTPAREQADEFDGAGPAPVARFPQRRYSQPRDPQPPFFADEEAGRRHPQPAGIVQAGNFFVEIGVSASLEVPRVPSP